MASESEAWVELEDDEAPITDRRGLNGAARKMLWGTDCDPFIGSEPVAVRHTPRRDRYRGLGEAPATPAPITCKHCGASVYVVSSQDGDDVVLDAETLDISGDGHSRMEYRLQAARTVGGYRLHEPQLFYGWFDPSEEGTGGVKAKKPEWQWFATRMSLSQAAANDVDIHSEHIVTCTAVDVRTLAAKLSNVALTGSASGDADKSRRTRRLRYEARHGITPQPAAAPVVETPRPVLGQLSLVDLLTGVAGRRLENQPRRVQERKTVEAHGRLEQAFLSSLDDSQLSLF